MSRPVSHLLVPLSVAIFVICSSQGFKISGMIGEQKVNLSVESELLSYSSQLIMEQLQLVDLQQHASNATEGQQQQQTPEKSGQSAKSRPKRALFGQTLSSLDPDSDEYQIIKDALVKVGEWVGYALVESVL